MKFAKKIRVLRQKAHLSQREVAEKIGVSSKAYCSYENNGTYPKQRQIYDRLAALYNVSRDYLLVEDDESEQLIEIRTDNVIATIIAQFQATMQDSSISNKCKSDLVKKINDIYFSLSA